MQSLWSGYGEIARYALDKSDTAKSAVSSCIAKVVTLQQIEHPRGWNTEASHQRKLSSYLNEQAFYRHFAQFTNDTCIVPDLHATSQGSHNMWMLLQDLDAAGYSLRSLDADENLVCLGISWLANFHACFMQDKHYANSFERPQWLHNSNKIWPIGTYWHLATRRQEWDAMPDSKLKRCAELVDARLNQARFQSLVHGDAKIANFCIHADKNQLAAVDFQYVGFGSGMKDLVYFLGSCLGEYDLQNNAERYLDMYIDTLKSALSKQASDNKHLALNEIEQECRDLYCFAWADFERFLVGWSPGHKKLNQYSTLQSNKALALIA